MVVENVTKIQYKSGGQNPGCSRFKVGRVVGETVPLQALQALYRFALDLLVESLLLVNSSAIAVETVRVIKNTFIPKIRQILLYQNYLKCVNFKKSSVYVHINLRWCILRQWLSIGDDFAPQDAFGSVWGYC